MLSVKKKKEEGGGEDNGEKGDRNVKEKQQHFTVQHCPKTQVLYIFFES